MVATMMEMTRPPLHVEDLQDDGEGDRDERDDADGRGELAERDERRLVGGDETAALQTDEGDEQSDADADGAAQTDRDGVHDGLAKAAQNEDQDDDALEEHDRHGDAPVDGDLAEAQGERDDGVDAHARRQRDRAVRDKTHRDGHDGGAQARRSERGVERMPAASIIDGLTAMM